MNGIIMLRKSGRRKKPQNSYPQNPESLVPYKDPASNTHPGSASHPQEVSRGRTVGTGHK